ncbi:MAG: hypothetical protein AAF573_01975 [Bacteroidota bacterium]
MESSNNKNTELLDDDWDFNYQKEVLWQELVWLAFTTLAYLLLSAIIFSVLDALFVIRPLVPPPEDYYEYWHDRKQAFIATSIPLIVYHYFAIKNHWNLRQIVDVKWRLISFLIYLISWVLILIFFFTRT